VPERTDRTFSCAVTTCPDCGGAVEDTGVVETVKVEELVPARIEVIAYEKHAGRCRDCGKTTRGSLPAELGPAPKTGVGLQALVVSLRHDFALPLPQIVAFLDRHVGLTITEGGVSQMLARLARRTEAARVEIVRDVRASPFVHMDETGWPQDGSGGWGWIARTPWATLFHIDPSRAHAVVEKLLGPNYGGVLVTDFFSAYTCDRSLDHQWDWAHLIRETKELVELDPQRRTRELRDRLGAIYRNALVAQDAQDLRACQGIRVCLGRLAHDADLRRHLEVRRLLNRIVVHFPGLLRFLYDPSLPADNNSAEREIRLLVRRRKISACTRSQRGSDTLAHWLSVTQTLKKQGSSIAEFLPAALRAYHAGTPPPSIIRSRC
jgi:transposase